MKPGREDDTAIDIVGRLKPGLSREAAAAGLTVWASRRPGVRSAESRLPPIRLTPRQGTLSADAGEALMIFSPIFFAFRLILMIGCANVANLQLARGVSRQREIGIRLSLGASRRRIVRQLLTESIRMAIVNESRRAALLRAVTAHPSVTAMAAASWRIPTVAETSAFADATAEGAAETSISVPVDQIGASPEYFSVLDIDLVSGRGFTQAERSPESGVAIVSETVVGPRPESQTLTSVDPGLGEVTTMRTIAGMQTYILQIAFWVAVALGGLAVVLTVSGLFSVLSYLVEQRAKDLGLRLALGATTGSVVGLVISQLLRPAARRSETWSMSSIPQRTLSLLVIVASCVLAASIPALRAVRIDPIATLRRD